MSSTAAHINPSPRRRHYLKKSVFERVERKFPLEACFLVHMVRRGDLIILDDSEEEEPPRQGATRTRTAGREV
ncbi:MAG TPA: hypothetical protein PLE70_02700 [Methanolinea sp.]|nr:hypothetical protein [Methanolinea sp.]